jgi:hypothetical protein
MVTPLLFGASNSRDAFKMDPDTIAWIAGTVLVAALLAVFGLIPARRLHREAKSNFEALLKDKPASSESRKKAIQLQHAYEREVDSARSKKADTGRRLFLWSASIAVVITASTLFKFFPRPRAPEPTAAPQPSLPKPPPSLGKTQFLREKIDPRLAEMLFTYLARAIKEIQPAAGQEPYLRAFQSSAEAFNRLVKTVPSTIRPAADQTGGAVAAVVTELEKKGPDTVVHYVLLVNPEVSRRLLETAASDPLDHALLVMTAIKEGAMLEGLRDDPAFYANLHEEREQTVAWSKHPDRAAAEEAIKGIVAKQIRAEELGYRLAARYLMALGHTSRSLRDASQAERANVWRHGILFRISRVVEILEAGDSEATDLALRRDILDVDVEDSLPEAYAIISVMEREGRAQSRHNRAKHFLLDPAYLLGGHKSGTGEGKGWIGAILLLPTFPLNSDVMMVGFAGFVTAALIYTLFVEFRKPLALPAVLLRSA